MEAGPWQRIWFMSAGVIFNVITGFIIFAIIGLTGLPRPQVDVYMVAKGSTAEQAGLKAGDAILKLNGVEIESLRDIEDEIGSRIPKPIDLEIWRDGQIINVTVQPSEVGLLDSSLGVYITEVVKDSPAALAGIKPGDRIVKVDELFVKNNQELLEYNRKNAGKEVAMLVERDGTQFTAKLTPRANPPSGQGPIGATIATATYDAAYGYSLSERLDGVRTTTRSLGDSISYGWTRTMDTLKLIAELPVRLFRGQVSAEEARPASVVAISQIGAQIIQQSFTQRVIYPILNFAALLSIFIGITQLLPIPGLDGGRIIFVIVELLRGKPLNQEREGLIHMVGIMLLLGLTVVIVVNDIVNPIVLPR
jgi:regulator of sigma E protease